MKENTGSTGKVKLTSYEFMTLLGATDPCLSKKLKGNLDKELEKPKYEGIEFQQAWGQAIYFLATEKPESFDLDNKDDCVSLRLTPFLIRKDGTHVPTEELMEKVEPDSVQVMQRDKGDYTDLEIIADGDDESLVTKARVKLTEPSPQNEFGVPVVHRMHSDPGNQSDEKKILLLKEKVLDATDFSEVFAYFMDEFADDPEFVKKGKLVTKAPRLKAALQHISKQLFPASNHQVRQIQLTHLKRHDFLHGTAILGGRITMIFFFQDLGFGMVAIDGSNGCVHYSRITMVQGDPRKKR